MSIIIMQQQCSYPTHIEVFHKSNRFGGSTQGYPRLTHRIVFHLSEDHVRWFL